MRFAYVRIAASVALQMQAVAIGWQMYEPAGSSFQLALIGLVLLVSAGVFRDLLRADGYGPNTP